MQRDSVLYKTRAGPARHIVSTYGSWPAAVHPGTPLLQASFNDDGA